MKWLRENEIALWHSVSYETVNSPREDIISIQDYVDIKLKNVLRNVSQRPTQSCIISVTKRRSDIT